MAQRALPKVDAFLTDGERLVQVLEQSEYGVRVEDSRHPSVEFVIPRGKLGRWRTVQPDPKEVAA